jgi:hypothetical protein
MQLFYSTEVSLLFRIIPKPTDAFSHFCHKLKSSVTLETRALVFAIITKQPFPLPHYRGISHLQSVAAGGAAQINSTFHVTATTRTARLH